MQLAILAPHPSDENMIGVGDYTLSFLYFTVQDNVWTASLQGSNGYSGSGQERWVEGKCGKISVFF
jgi:hypothetical protein